MLLFWPGVAFAEPDDTEASEDPQTDLEVEAQPDLQDEPAEEPKETESYEIPTLEAELPSALHTGELEAGEDDGSMSAALQEYGFGTKDFDKPALVQGAWFIRPRLAISTLLNADTKGPAAMRLGLSAGRRFWTIEALPIQLAADVGLRGTFPVGGAKGRRVEGFANVGPWLGPARIQIGLAARWEREFWHQSRTELAEAIHLGPSVRAAFDLKHLQVTLGWTPMWKAWGPRLKAAAGNPTLPQLANETTWSAGVRLPLGAFRIGGDVSWRDTEVGSLLEVGILLGLDLAKLMNSGSSQADEEAAE